MKKNREFDRLGHFLLMQTSASLVDAINVKNDIDASTKVSGKAKRELYSDMIDANIESQRLVASIMSAAGNSPTFRFSEEDVVTLSIKDVAERLGIKVECSECGKASKEDMEEKLEEIGKIIADKMGLDGTKVHAFKMDPAAAKTLGSILDKISKIKGEK